MNVFLTFGRWTFPLHRFTNEMLWNWEHHNPFTIGVA